MQISNTALTRDMNMGIMRSLCGYVKIPKTHPAYKKVTKRSWFDLELSHWQLLRDEAKRKGLAFTTPKPKSHRRYRYNYEHADLHVHGGLTFGEVIRRKDQKDFLQPFTVGLWVGWDYQHAGDEMYLPTERIVEADEQTQNVYTDIMAIHRSFPRSNDKLWEWDEVVTECKNAIRQLIRLENGYSKCLTCVKEFNPETPFDGLCWSCEWDRERVAKGK